MGRLLWEVICNLYDPMIPLLHIIVCTYDWSFAVESFVRGNFSVKNDCRWQFDEIIEKKRFIFLVFMASTINGYEGTGRSLSLKLLDQLRKQSSATGYTAQKGKDGDAAKIDVGQQTSSR